MNPQLPGFWLHRQLLLSVGLHIDPKSYLFHNSEYIGFVKIRCQHRRRELTLHPELVLRRQELTLRNREEARRQPLPRAKHAPPSVGTTPSAGGRGAPGGTHGRGTAGAIRGREPEGLGTIASQVHSRKMSWDALLFSSRIPSGGDSKSAGCTFFRLL